jgi:SRSO17 transposase
MVAIEVDQRSAELDRLRARIAGRFGRAEPRRRAGLYLSGLVTGPVRKNNWTMAEGAGDPSPDGMQRLLRSAQWDVDGVRDDIRDYVVERLGDPGALLIAGNALFPKKGIRSAGVTRQAQIGVFLAYRVAAGEVLIDRQLYLPREWTDDRSRCRAAGIGDEITYRSERQIVEDMLTRATAAGVPARRVLRDDHALRDCVRRARDRAGLDQYQVRDWRAWHAHITLSMAAYAALVVAGK